jgi:hypothetical protein
MKPSSLVTISFFYLLLFSTMGCSSSEIGESKDVSQETIYQQYAISYDEGEENATVYVQFRFAGDNGTTLVLTKPAAIQFDGVKLTVDSSDFEGAFYRKSIPVNNFYGDHLFTYTDINKKKFENNFSVGQFRLVNVPENAVKHGSLKIPFEGMPLGPDDYIELTAVDTDSTFSVTNTSKDTDPFITIEKEEIERQTGSYLKLAATLYRKIALQQNTTEGGKLQIEHALKPVIIKLLR